MNQNLKNKRRHYYEKKYIQFELLNAMRDREVVFIDKDNPSHVVRCMFLRNLDNLEKAFQVFGFYNKNYNIYISVARYSNIPMFTPNLKERSTETSEWFRKEAKSKIINYDLLLDFDSKSQREWLKMKDQVFRTAKSLEISKVIFYLIPSGNNFQIVIDSNFIPSIMTKSLQIVKNMIEVLNMTYLDTKGIGSEFKIMKCPYSLVDDRVCLPLDNLTYFDWDMRYNDFDCIRVLNKVPLKKRGLRQFNFLHFQDGKENFIKWLLNYSLDSEVINEVD